MTTQESAVRNDFPKLHNAMWPGLIGKASQGGEEPDFSLERMVELTAQASVSGQKFDGVDVFLFHPHIDPDANDDKLRRIADMIANQGLAIGSLVAPVWPGTVGGSAMGSSEDREKFVLAVRKACRIAQVFNQHGVRQYGCIRIDSAAGNDDGKSLQEWEKSPGAYTTRIAQTFCEAAKVAHAHGEKLTAEGEICWAGMHSLVYMRNLLEEVAELLGNANIPLETVGFQADLAHTFLYLLSPNAPDQALLVKPYDSQEFDDAYAQMIDALKPWMNDFHIAQNDGTIHGTGAHDMTGRHCPADDPNGKLNIAKAAGFWLAGAKKSGLRHVCWDGCMFPNKMLENPATWNTILAVMLEVRQTHGWQGSEQSAASGCSTGT